MSTLRLLPRAALPAALLGLCLAGTATVSACRSTSPAVRDDANAAECPVCKHEGDLACLHLEVGPDTPRAEWNGKTYYFCSDACRDDFLKHPEEYADR